MKFALPALMLFFASVTHAFAGMEGGGGKTVVCRNADGSIHSAEILDLYEGRTIHQLKYSESSEAWKNQAYLVLEKSGVSVWQSMPRSGIYDWFLNATQHLVFLPEGTKLKQIDDSFEAVIPVGCVLEQTVNYVNDNQILVDTEIWNALSETQKAALMLHEAIYRHLRSSGEKDSRRARHLNAHIVSGGKVEAIFPGNSYFGLCNGGEKFANTAFYVFETPGHPERLRLQFSHLGGRKLLSAAYVDLDRNVISGYPDLLEQFKHPSVQISFETLSLSSLFEAGDSIQLGIWNNAEGGPSISVQGVSIVDGSTVGPVEMSCFWLE